MGRRGRQYSITGMKTKRRILILRRKKRKCGKNNKEEKPDQMLFNLGKKLKIKMEYEYAILITNLTDPLYTVSCHYYDRADAENNFDELKNQWGWAGFMTQDITRCRLMARINALVYNWWSIFMRLAVSDKHMEAIKSRPLFLHGVGRMIQTSRQTFMKISSLHGQSFHVEKILKKINSFMQWIKHNAEQLKLFGIYRMILSIAFNVFLNERPLKVPKSLVYN